MLLRKGLLCLALGSFSLSWGQAERNIWYFGNFAGLDFNAGTPIPLLDGALSTSEGCASIADENGALLFYTDGITIWNQNHVPMPNGTGLLGDPSSTQSGVIVPKPGAPNIYYVFTVPAQANAAGLRYSEVDMTLSGGLGDVTLVKNILLATPVCEKITVVEHSNGTDYWVISHRYDSGSFISFHLSASGIDMVPLESNVGLVVFDDGGINSIGHLKTSSDATRIVAAHWTLNLVEVFDVDNSTGLVSNPITLDGFVAPGAYGAEFSPSGQFLYISEANGSGSNVYQFDLLAGGEIEVNNSQVLLSTLPSVGGALQLGPDNKIYCTYFSASALDVIQSPDLPGAACQYLSSAQPLGGPTGTLGLPTFIDSRTSFGIVATEVCPQDTTLFAVLPEGAADSIFWNFGDPGSGLLNFSTDLQPAHFYSVGGSYQVQAIVFDEGLADTLDLEVQIILPVGDVLGPDGGICPNGSLVLDATIANATYSWQNNSTSATFLVQTPGTYWVNLTLSGCSFSDTVNVVEITPPAPVLGPDLSLCLGDNATLLTGISNAEYLWSDGTTNPALEVDSAGIYWVTVVVSGCSGSDTTVVSFIPCDVVVEMPNVISPNGSGLNDFWEPVFIQGVGDIESSIYNRWGQLVHSSSGVPRWNGKRDNSDPVPEGTYFWLLRYTDLRDGTYEQRGTLTVLR